MSALHFNFSRSNLIGKADSIGILKIETKIQVRKADILIELLSYNTGDVISDADKRKVGYAITKPISN